MRRRAAELAPSLGPDVAAPTPTTEAVLVALLRDDDVTVVEAAAWALGEQGCRGVDRGGRRAGGTATGTPTRSPARPRSQRSAPIGDPAGLDAILAACGDKPAVRRRAVLALAPFDGAGGRSRDRRRAR